MKPSCYMKSLLYCFLYGLVVVIVFPSCESIKASEDASIQKDKYFSNASSSSNYQKQSMDLAFNVMLEGFVSFDYVELSDSKTKTNTWGVLVEPEFVQKKSKLSYSIGKATTSLNYLELPLVLSQRMNLNNEAKLTLGIGPYFSYGLGGKIKSTFAGTTDEEKVFSSGSGYKRFDGGLCAVADYQLAQGLSFGLSYDFGLANIYKDSGEKVRNRTIAVNIGYAIFSKLKHNGGK
jgi:Outer membrane protein beta-barrel domain